MPTRAQSARTTIGTVVVTAFLAAAAGASSGPDSKAQFDALLTDAWELDMRESPLFATRTGDHRFDDRLPSMTMADLERRTAASRAQLARLQAIDRAALAPADRVSYDMFGRGLQDDLARDAFRSWRVPITSDSGFHTGISRLAQEVPLATVKDYENYIARLRAVPAYFDQHVAFMREGLRTGFTSPRITLEGYDATMRTHVVDSPEKSVFWKPFGTLPAGVPATEHERLRAAGRDAIATAVVPAYRSLLDFFTHEYGRAPARRSGPRRPPTGRPITRGS